MSNQVLDEVRGLAEEPKINVFKVGPEVFSEFTAKALIMMGATPDDIRKTYIEQTALKKLEIRVVVDKESEIFNQAQTISAGLTMLGRTEHKFRLSDRATGVLRDLGFYHPDEKTGRPTYAVELIENKKTVDLIFNTDIAAAIVTDTNFQDIHFRVDTVEETVRVKKGKGNRKKYKESRRTVVFSHIHRSHDSEGFDPQQVIAFFSDDQDEDDDDIE
jgi:hypothetical protein